MSAEIKKEIQLEIAHVLFMDIVGYSKRLINDQRGLLDTLNQIVRSTDEFRSAEAEGRLIKIPTGDGIALVFYNSPETPVECALDISRALKAHPNLPLRMGVHSGPVSGVIDVNERANVAGAGINMAQRVMDCGDAGHILLSKHVAEDLEQYEHWQPHLHDLGECEVKHGVRVHIVNLYTEELGNRETPQKFKQLRGKWKMSATISGSPVGSTSRRWARIAAVVLIASAFAVALMMFWHRLSPKSSSASLLTPPPSAIPDKSIAVLPLQNLSRDPDNAYFAVGIQDEILTRLAKIADLKVISRTSTQRFKSAPDNLPEIAKQLGVANILEGSVQKANGQVRVNVQLINATNDAHLWADIYDRKLTDLFAVESDIAKTIAETLQAKLTGSEQNAIAARPTENPEAYQLYLQGVFYDARGTEADYRKAIDFYNAAIRLDPRYALAYTGLSIQWTNLARKFLNSTEVQQAYVQARAAADAALALAPDLAAAHSVRGIVLESADFDWSGAEAEYRRALQLAPNDGAAKGSLGALLAILGHPDQAVELVRQELTSDPLCASCYNWLSSYLSPLGRLDEAEQAIRKAIELQPGHADYYTQLAIVAIQRGDAKAALSAAQQEIAAGGWQDIALALAQQISGDPVAADAALKTLVDKQANDAAYQIAQVYALRNDPGNVFEWLDHAWANRDVGVGKLLYDPFIIRYKQDPRFAAFCRKAGLPVPGEPAVAKATPAANPAQTATPTPEGRTPGTNL